MQDSGDAKNGAGVFARLQKTRRKLERGLAGLFAAGGGAQLDELHDQLLLADVGVEASGRIIDNLRGAAKKQNDGGALRGALRDCARGNFVGLRSARAAAAAKTCRASY